MLTLKAVSLSQGRQQFAIYIQMYCWDLNFHDSNLWVLLFPNINKKVLLIRVEDIYARFGWIVIAEN